MVGEDDIAEAMVWLLERSKLVVEGGGAVGVAALLAGQLNVRRSVGSTVIVLSGGNVDAGLLAAIARVATRDDRRTAAAIVHPDLPTAREGWPDC